MGSWNSFLYFPALFAVIFTSSSAYWHVRLRYLLMSVFVLEVVDHNSDLVLLLMLFLPP